MINNTPITIRLSATLRSELKRIAKLDRVSLSKLVESILINHFTTEKPARDPNATAKSIADRASKLFLADNVSD